MLGAETALADLYVSSGSYEAAEHVVEANPRLPDAEVLRAQVELAKGNLGTAEQLDRAALERDPVSLPALEILVKLDANNGKAQEAVRKLSGLVFRYPQNAGLRLLLALGYFDVKDFEKSKASAREALALDAQTPDAHALLAAIDYATGLMGPAEAELRAEITGSSRKASNYIALSHVYEAEGKWEDAKRTLESARAEVPASPDVKNNLAYLYLEHGGDSSAALSLALEAKRALPDSPVVADTLGWAFYKLGSYESAIAQLRIGARKVPKNALYQYHLGMAYFAAGRSESASGPLQRALRSDPNFAHAASARAALDAIAKRN